MLTASGPRDHRLPFIEVKLFREEMQAPSVIRIVAQVAHIVDGFVLHEDPIDIMLLDHDGLTANLIKVNSKILCLLGWPIVNEPPRRSRIRRYERLFQGQ